HPHLPDTLPISSYPPPQEHGSARGNALPLPGLVDLFPTYEENFRLFRVLAAQQAGRREFGTYDFSLSVLWPCLPVPLRQLLGEQVEPAGGLADYFHRFPHPDLVEALSVLLETRRVSARLSD